MFIISIFIMAILAAVLLQLREWHPNVKELDKHFPLYKVENDFILSKQGDVTAAFIVQLPEIFTLSAEDYDQLHAVWLKAIRLLPPGTVVQKQDWFTQQNYQAPIDTADTFLAQSSHAFFNGRPFLDHQCYLMLTRKHPAHKPASSVFNNLLRPPVRTSPADRRAWQEFAEKVSQFEKLLQVGGYMQTKRLSTAELTGDKQTAGLLERYMFLLHPKDPANIRDVVFKPDMQIGENHCQVFSLGDVTDLPAKCANRAVYDKYSTERTRFPVGFSAPIGLFLSCNHLYNQVLVVEDTPKTLKKLESKRRRLQSLSTYSRENLLSRDATNDFLNEAISEQRLPVKAHYNLLCWTNDREQITEIRNLTAAAITQMDATPRQETQGAAQLYWAGVPGNIADLPENDMFDTFAEQGICFFNMESNYRSSPSSFGFWLGDRMTGKPVFLDIDDEIRAKNLAGNSNAMVISGSGGGKSFFMNHLCRSYHDQGMHIVMIDVGHSYQTLCKMLHGTYLTYEENNPITFNPFFVSPGDYMDTERKESLKTLLLALWKRSDEVFYRSEYVALSNALQLYYEYLKQHTEIFACFNSFYDFLQSEYVEVLKREKVKDKEFDIANFLYVLRPFYRGGEFDYLLNSTTNLDLLNERFLVFELDNIKENQILFTVTTLMCMSVFISKMRKLKGVRKMIVIEEAWKAIAKEGMAEYIKYLYKTVRKFWGKVIVVTQELEDTISSPIIKNAIVNNADVKILLDQSKFVNKFDLLQELLGLDDNDKAQILSMNRVKDGNRRFKEVFFSPLKRVYRVEVSPEEYFTYTTEEKEKVKVLHQLSIHNGDAPAAIRAVIAEQQHNKAA